MTPRRTLGLCCGYTPQLRGTLALCCVHIPQLITHPVIETTLFTLQLCYKPLGIPQRITNRQQVHISSHDGLQNSITSTLLIISLRVS